MDTPFATWLRRSLTDRRLRPAALARELGVQPSTIARWLSGEARPRFETLAGLAAALDVDVDFLCGLTGYTHGPASITELSDEERELLAYFKRLSAAERTIILAAARAGGPHRKGRTTR